MQTLQCKTTQNADYGAEEEIWNSLKAFTETKTNDS